MIRKSPDGSYDADAFFEPVRESPRWRARRVANVRTPFELVRDPAEPSVWAGRSWANRIEATPLFAPISDAPYYISPEPSAAEMAAMEAMADGASSGPSGTVDIDIEGVAETKEVDVGALVIRRAEQNNAPRKKIFLKSTASTGNATLTRNNTKVRVFNAATGGTEITFDGTDNMFPVADLDPPKELYVQGDAASDQMRDVELKLTLDNGVWDRVTFTVLWVTVTTKHVGTVATDNSARNEYQETMAPTSFSLGHHLAAYRASGASLIRGSEFIGTVAPSDFAPSQFGAALHLDREVVGGKRWWGKPNGNENDGDIAAKFDTSPFFFETTTRSPASRRRRARSTIWIFPERMQFGPPIQT